ncbi:MAG: peptidylprolyl isomerase [Gammaproteobacteria bacterium]
MHSFRQSLLAAAAVLAALAAVPAQPARAQVTEPIDSIVALVEEDVILLALVEEDVILRSELDQAIKSIVERIRSQGGNLPPQDLLEKQVLERLVVRKLQVQRAMRTGIRVSDSDIDQALLNLARQNNITVTQLREVIESDGEDFAEFRRSIGEEIMSERLRQRVVSSMEPVSETEIDIMLASEDFSGGEYDVSHIMVAVPDGATPQQVQEAEEKITGIRTQLDDGLDFTSAAISFSESQDALEGGKLGWRDLNSVPREFADAIRDLEPGQYTQPIRSPAGFHIVRVNDYRDRQRVMAEEYRANHIMITPNELVTQREAMEQIRELREQIEDGALFAELARQYSDDTTSANLGGDMGWFSLEQFGPRFQAMVEGLEDGELSEPFQTEAGWHLVQRTGYRETDVTEQAMRNMARQTIMQRRADSEIEGFLRQLREEAFVELRLPT